MNCEDLVRQIIESDDITIIAGREVMSNIVMGIGIKSSWDISLCKCSENRLFLLTKLGTERPTLIVENAIGEDGKLVNFEAKELKVDYECFHTFIQLDLLRELRENIENFCLFDSRDFK